MVNAAAPLAPINLLFALLARMLALFGLGPKPPALVVRALERGEAALADAIRATLRESGLAFPELPDAAFLGWFNRNHPCSDKSPRRVWREGLPARRSDHRPLSLWERGLRGPP
jgi:hypothetical protein